MLLGRKGRNQQVLELSSTVPYDAFKVDVYGLRDMYAGELVEARVSFTEFFRHVGVLPRVTRAQAAIPSRRDETRGSRQTRVC
ncbi:hypothetical protein C8Q76DRAFT_714998 [Earliella scabrosa]|nr:hypothetical protein C8Q76DRAFT_714998 [Earliella scabrosa]